MNTNHAHPMLSSLENYVLRGWNSQSESAVLALCIFATLSVAVVVILMVCVSADAAGIFCVSLGGLLAAVGLAQQACKRYTDSFDADSASIDEAVPRGEPQRGSSVVEFSFIFPVVIVAIVGLFGLGQAFYTYNSLQSAMRSAARYGSLAPYDLPNGTQWSEDVRNMAVYGEPDPGPNAQPLVPGFTASNVQATAYIPETEPTVVTVAVDNFEFDYVVFDFKVSQPVVKFPFLGRALIP